MVHSKSSRSGSANSAQLGVRLGPEVLNNDFLDMTVGGVQIGNRFQRVDPLVACLADADQDAGRERSL